MRTTTVNYYLKLSFCFGTKTTLPNIGFEIIINHYQKNIFFSQWNLSLCFCDARHVSPLWDRNKTKTSKT